MKKKTTTSELNPKANENYRLHAKFSQQTKLLFWIVICTIASVFNWYDAREFRIIANNAVTKAIEAKVMVEYELEATRQEIVLMKNEVRLLEVYVQDLEATIKVNEYVTP